MILNIEYEQTGDRCHFQSQFLSLINQVSDYQIIYEEDRDNCLKMALVKVVEISQKMNMYFYLFSY